MADSVRVLVLVLREPAPSDRWAMVAVSDPVDGTEDVRVVGVDGSVFVEPAGFLQEHDTGIEQAAQWADRCIRELDGSPQVDEVVVMMPEPVLWSTELPRWFERAFGCAGTVAECTRSRDTYSPADSSITSRK